MKIITNLILYTEVPRTKSFHVFYKSKGTENQNGYIGFRDPFSVNKKMQKAVWEPVLVCVKNQFEP